MEGMITGWARTLQHEAQQSSRVFEVLVPSFPTNPTDIGDSDRKAVTIEGLVRNNGSRVLHLTRPDDNSSIRTAKSGGEASRETAIVLVFTSCQLANNAIENGLHRIGEHHRCELTRSQRAIETMPSTRSYGSRRRIDLWAAIWRLTYNVNGCSRQEAEE